MSSTFFEALDIPRLFREYPSGAAFPGVYQAMSTDELRAIQERRLLRVMRRGWTTPFYRRLWGREGIEPGDISGLDDLHLLPVYDKSDIMAAVEAHPPLGGMTGTAANARGGGPPMILHTTSGTTGTPQPLIFGPWGREVANLLVGRMYTWQGLEAGDVVHSVYGHGMVNGGHYIREAVTHFTPALFLSAGTGNETPSRHQVRLMNRFGATVLVGFVDYLRRLAEVAEREGLDPGLDIPVRMIIGHLGTGGRREIEQAWGGAPAYDWYGVADTGSVAGEGPDRDGMYVWEDAHCLEVLDPESGEATTKGDMVITCLYKEDLAPVIRFNTHDVTEWLAGSGAAGLVFRRIRGFLGRSDNMVKVRGVNVYPDSLAGWIAVQPGCNGAYYCRVTRDPSGREELTVVVEGTSGNTDRLAHELRLLLGVVVHVDLQPPGSTAMVTGVDRRQKPIRLVDERK
ncbi:MAG: phenylacetate--CoA ligase family protein [bacterium]|nr:phenylacetate--CoA ligase family protein [bacterium]MDE0290657.1 phenylacetate--CoA ligase family protein [bacterium]MDE0439110.1 phenylacetate--CoA ligase family protein [bacterium]